MRFSAGIGALLLAGMAGPALAQQSVSEWLDGEYATGDWGGMRTKMQDAGVTFEGGYTTDIMAVRNGNAGSGDGWDYAGRMDFGLNFDLEKLVGATGLSFYVSGAWSSGQNLSERQVGNLFAVQQIFTGQEARLSQLYFQQKLLDDQLKFKIGRLTTEEDFLASDIYANYVNGGINGTPANVPGGNAGFTTAPFVQWGAVGAYELTDGLRFAVGVYNADEKTIDDHRNGTRFTLDLEDHVFGIGEVSYGWNQLKEPEEGKEQEVPEGLAGMVKLGIFGQSGHHERVDGEGNKNGSAGFYVSGQQIC